ncbi:MAG: SpoVG family protein [Lachnospiraceae bacterium]|nr:SpoVG family protein [Lachnospiraceae bacterium]
MEVTQIKMTVLDNAGATKAIGSISFNDELAVRGIRVMESSDGRKFISFPARQRADGQYDDIAFPLTKELYHKISDAVIKEYNHLKETAEKEEAKDEFMEASKVSEQTPVFMESPAPEQDEQKTQAPKARKGRGR